MHMRQCPQLNLLTSPLSVETLTFSAMLRLLGAAQMVPRWDMVALCPGALLPQGARFSS